jgi:hypothetical protein
MGAHVRSSNKTKEAGAQYLAILMKQRASLRTLCDVAGGSYRHVANVRGWVEAYRAVWLVYIYEYNVRGRAVYALQPALYELSDAEVPEWLKTA